MPSLASNNKENPLVSVIIPFFNRENFLAETIESVIAQTYENWEIILVDDGSTDCGRDIARRYELKDPERFFIYSHPDGQNLGASASRNLGLRHARGDFIKFLDSDDVLYPSAFAKELAGFDENREADAVCGTIEVWYSWNPADAEQDFRINLVLETEKLYQPPSLLVHNLNASGRKPVFNATLIKRDLLTKTGGFAEEFGSVGEDQSLWAKISLNGTIYIIGDTLARYRQHPDSTCARLNRNGVDIDNWTKFFDWLENYLSEQDMEYGEVRVALANFKRRQKIERRLKPLKQFYRRLLPLRWRYRLRDKLTSFRKGYLSGDGPSA